MKVVRFLAAIALPALVWPVAARTPSVSTAREVNAAVRTYFKENPPAVGLSIGVYRRGRTWTYNFGRRDRDRLGAPTADTLYAIASISKTLTGALMAKASLAGKLGLDDDVRRYLDGDYPNLAFAGRPIRLVDLLDHRSGLPNMLPDRPAMQPSPAGGDTPWTIRLAEAQKNWRREDFFAALHEVKLTRPPGENTSYSNAGAMLAGYALERVYGLPFERLAQRELLVPLGMRDTAIVLSAPQTARMAPGYNDDGVRMPSPPPLLQAAAGFRSSVNDMLRYIRWGVTETDPAARLSHRPVVIVPPADTGLAWPYAAGLNWQEILASPGGKTERLIWQTGSIDGYFSICIEEPERGLGLVVLSNQNGTKTGSAMKRLANAILRATDEKAALVP